MPAPPVAADQRLERHAPAGLPAGNVFAAKLFYTYVPKGSKQNEWNVIGILDNDADEGENCAGYLQANAYGRGHTWGLCIEASDHGGKNPSLSPLEVDLWARGDNPGNGLHVVVGDSRQVHNEGSTPGRVSGANALLVSNNGNQNARWVQGLTVRHFDRAGISVEGDGGDFGVRFSGRMTTALDFTAAETQSTIRLRDGQWISLDATDSVQIGYQLGRVKITLCGKPLFEIDINTGDRYVRGNEYKL